MIETFEPLEIFIIVMACVLSILLIIAVLKIPQIARNTKATMKLMALMAKRQGVDVDAIRRTVYQADPEVLNDKKFEQHIDS